MLQEPILINALDEFLEWIEVNFEALTEDNIRINMAERGASKGTQSIQKITGEFIRIGSKHLRSGTFVKEPDLKST